MGARAKLYAPWDFNLGVQLSSKPQLSDSRKSWAIRAAPGRRPPCSTGGPGLGDCSRLPNFENRRNFQCPFSTGCCKRRSSRSHIFAYMTRARLGCTSRNGVRRPGVSPGVSPTKMPNPQRPGGLSTASYARPRPPERRPAA